MMRRGRAIAAWAVAACVFAFPPAAAAGVTRAAALAALGLLLFAAPAAADFPYRYDGTTPNDLTDKRVWMYAATPEEGNEPVNSQEHELRGVRGAHLVDADAEAGTAWQTSTGRPDVTIAVLDSGIKWNDGGAMADLRRKTRLWKPELERPAANRGGDACASYRAGAWDANGDGVFNVDDYACDLRVAPDPPNGVGPPDVLDPQDVLIAFSDGDDDDGNGFADDIVGWDFLDDDNDPFDDVQYGHGTGEARDSSAEANNDGELGTCPNCMVIHMRVGDSFIADSADFGQAVLYAVDNNAFVIQEALGTLNNTGLGRAAVEYAYRHGVAVIASAADEAAQHHNYPSNYPHTVVVNSVTKYDETLTPAPRSYLQFNGCTNFSSKIALAIPSVSCSSDATGRGSGMAGLVYSAALDAIERGDLAPHPDCRLTNGDPCPLSANEVRQLLISGADDVSFADQPEPACHPNPSPACTDPNLNAPGNWLVLSPVATTRRYPARKGHDQFYGYGRVNMDRSVDAVAAGDVPPEAEITAPEWYEQVDPGQGAFDVRGEVGARRAAYSCRVLVAPGSQPNNAETTDAPPGDFAAVPSPWCDGSERTEPYAGTLASIDVAALKARFPASAGDFRGRESGANAATHGRRPNSEPYGFTVKVLVTSGALRGEDRRNLFLHRDRDLIDGFPLRLPSDGESSPAFADLDGDNANELILATADGVVHAYRPNGSELRGWPVRGDRLPLHVRGRAFRSRQVPRTWSGSFLASVAAGDLDRDGAPEVVAADFEGRLYAWNARGRRVLAVGTDPAWSGAPLEPFVNEREGPRNRTQHGFFGSPVLADLDADGELEIVAAAMDRHLYAWHHDGSIVSGFPVLVVDPTKVESIDPRSHQVRFNEAAGEALNQGAIIDTPAVGDLTGDGLPEIVLGTNEEYLADAPGEGGFNAGNLNTASLAVLGQTGLFDFAHGRVYAVRPTGDPDLSTAAPDGAFLDGWPVKIGRVFAELLPVVGEGITGSPVIGPATCPSGGAGPKVGTIPDAGPGYLLNADGSSCFGTDPTNGKDLALQSDIAVAAGKLDLPVLPAVGHPAFGDFGGGVTFLAPSTGIVRALDLAVNEYQALGQDFMAAWNPSTGQFRANFPQQMNDLQFLTGPSVADIDGRPGEELLAGSAYLDLQAYSGNGAPVSDAWPKLTSDWTVANPLIGSFGGGARKTVVTATRDGRVFAYSTDSAACSPGSWPRFHHDNFNSGDYSRDAVAPGALERLRFDGTRLAWGAPGDDLLCGRAARYEVVTSNRRITGRTFASRRPVAGAPEPLPPGAQQSLALPAGAARWIAIRAVDEQGNVGPVSSIRVR